MPSEVDICNQALLLLGDTPISAFTDGNDRARIAGRLYGPTRDATLRAHPWNFAIYRAALARETVTPEFGWAYQYALPTDPPALRVLGPEEIRPGSIPWAIERRKFVCDEESVKIKFIAQVTDPNQFDTLFIDALAARLAAKFALSLTRDKDLVKMALSLYESLLEEARTVNGQEGTRETIVSDDLITARHGDVYPDTDLWGR